MLHRINSFRAWKNALSLLTVFLHAFTWRRSAILTFSGLLVVRDDVTCNPSIAIATAAVSNNQRWSRGHKARGQDQGHKKNSRPRPRTAFPRTDTLEAKDRNARGQGQGPRIQEQVLSKKKVFTKVFQAISKKKKKRSTQKFFKRSPKKNVFQKNFQALYKILTIQKIVLSSSRGQANFRGLEASRPRPRTSKCVLEDVLEAKDVLEDSTSGNNARLSIASRVAVISQSSK